MKINIEDCELQPFELVDTRDQLKRQEPGALPLALEIQELGRGNPLSNCLMAKQVTTGHPPQLDRAKALKLAVDVLMESVPSQLYACFEALCVLRAFDEERMPYLLATYHKRPVAQWNYSECTHIRQAMVATRLAQWDETLGGYAMDRDLRTVLENYLFERNANLGRKLHCQAYLLYRDWSRHYHTRWETEASYHAEYLTNTGYDPEDCSTYSLI